ncbi:hypothetical protein BGX38DRAFT_1240232, partial [Terfezia claveryi]
ALASGTHWDVATGLGTHWNVAPSPGTQHQYWAVDLASGTHWDVAPVPGTQAYMQPLSRCTCYVAGFATFEYACSRNIHCIRQLLYTQRGI